MNFYEIRFLSFNTKEVITQMYKAPNMEDAKEQHLKCNQNMRQWDKQYEAEIITCHEVTSKSKIKRITADW